MIQYVENNWGEKKHKQKILDIFIYLFINFSDQNNSNTLVS